MNLRNLTQNCHNLPHKNSPLLLTFEVPNTEEIPSLIKRKKSVKFENPCVKIQKNIIHAFILKVVK